MTTLPEIAQERLLKNASMMEYLRAERGLSEATVKDAELGLREDGRLTVPITDAEGQVIAKRIYNREPADGKPKWTWARGSEASLWVRQGQNLGGEVLILTEGEFDCLLTGQHLTECDVATGTAGAGWVPGEEDLEQLRGADVAVVYDCDAAGRVGARKVAAALVGVAERVRVVDLGLGDGEDLTDWFVTHGRTADALRALIAGTPAGVPTLAAHEPAAGAGTPGAPEPFRPVAATARRPKLDLLAWALGRAIPEGRRHADIGLACQLRDERYSTDEAEQVMRQYAAAVADAKPDKPYTVETALLALRSAYSREPREPSGIGAGSGLGPDRERIDSRKIRLNEERIARRELDAEDWAAPPDHGTLAAQLARDLPPVRYVVKDLWTEGGNVLLVAQYKTGKTTLALNLARALVDGEPLFDSFVVDHPVGRVGWWNAELDERMALNWLRRMNIAAPERIVAAHLRGHSMPLLTEPAQDWAVEWLRRHEVKTWVVDPFGALFDGEENSNSEVNAWLKALDSVKRRAGVEQLALVAHTGHLADAETEVRSRGAVKLMDWADATWTYRRGDDPTATRRYVSARGRDVEVAEFAVDFDPGTSALVRGEAGASRRGDRERRHAEDAAEKVREHHAVKGEPMSKTALENAMSGKSDNKRQGIDEAVRRGWVVRTSGPNKTQLHAPGKHPDVLSLAPRGQE